MVTQLSIFLPAYNEGENLPFLIEKCDQFLKKNLKKYEIIVVNDGSKDDTKKVVEGLQKKFLSLRLVNHKTNLGYGQAIRTGIKESKFPWVFFMDSDNQFDINDLKKFLSHDDADLVIGYRIKRDDPFTRILASRVYGLFVKSLFGLKVKDIDCAFKLMKKDSVKDLGYVSNSFFFFF